MLPRSLARDDVVPRWTRIGVVDGSASSTVDERGLVTLGDRVSIDWAIGAEDRWYHPAVEPNVTQVRLDHAPVIETELRVPGGTVVHRAYAARGPRYDGGDEWIVVEVENRSAVPVVLGWVVRPFSPVAVAPIERIGVVPSGSSGPSGPSGSSGPQALLVDGEAVGLLPRAPSRWAAGTGGDDPLAAVAAGAAAIDGPPLAVAQVASPGDDRSAPAVPASLAVLHPLPHTASTRLLLLPGGAHAAPAWPSDLPEAASVASGWNLRADQGARVVLPDPVLDDAVEAARRAIALNHRVERAGAPKPDRAAETHHRLTAGTGIGAADGVAAGIDMLASEAWWAPPGESAGPASRWGGGQRSGATFGSIDATAAAVRALALHAIGADDTVIPGAWLPELSGAIEVLGRAVRRGEGDPATVAEGLDAAALLLDRLGQPDAAARVRADVPVRGATPSSTAESAAPVAPDRAAAADPRRVSALAVAAARDGRPNEPLWQLLRAASSTWTWPDVERWTGDDGLVTARLLDAVARLLLRDGPDGLALVPWLPPGWWGQGWEVHGAPTRWGRLSYAVRWHGDRPAVLWDVAGRPADDLVPLTAPGLDPTWATTAARGEALLAAVPRPPGDDVDAGAPVTGDGPAAGPRGVAIAAPPRSVWRPQDPGPDAPAASDAPDASSHGDPAGAPADRPDGTGSTSDDPPSEGASFT